MASYLSNPKVNLSKISSTKKNVCDCCHSSDFVQTKMGKVCKTCGAVDEQKVLKYHLLFNDAKVQHAPLANRTQVGTIFECSNSKNSQGLISLMKTNRRYNNADYQLEIGRVEISRIFHALQLPHRLKKEAFLAYSEVSNRITPGTKFRSPTGLAAVVVYTMMKLKNLSVDQDAILQVTHLSRREFNEFKLKVCPLFRYYSKRDRKAYISQKLLEISEQFKIGMKFYFRSKELLDMMWSVIKNTSDELVAGVVASLSLLSQESGIVTVSSICKRLGIMPSTVHTQVRKHIRNNTLSNVKSL